MRKPIPRTLAVLAGLFALEFVVLAIGPTSRADWALENALTLAAVGRARGVLPPLPLLARLLHADLHLHVPAPGRRALHLCRGALRRLVQGPDRHGFSTTRVGWERNNFDRVVHFSYGLLLAYPIREVFLRVADVRGFWGYFLPLDLTMSTSMLSS